MSLDYEIRPLGIWPGVRTMSRKRSAFKIVESKVLQHLQREIRHLWGKQVVFRLAVREQDIRQDGMLRANARPTDPGMILEFTAEKLTGEPRLLYRCDTFSNWWHNLSAIARGLEALRMVDRYGVTPTGEQYAGFKALPSVTAPTMTTEVAANIVANHSDETPVNIIRSTDVARAATRAAKFRSHPDRNAGNSETWESVQAAITVLSSHHGVSL